MNHNFDHCTGDYFSKEDALDVNLYTCKKRDTCKRYLAKQALKQDKEDLPKGYVIYFLSADTCIANGYKNYEDGRE